MSDPVGWPLLKNACRITALRGGDQSVEAGESMLAWWPWSNGSDYGRWFPKVFSRTESGSSVPSEGLEMFQMTDIIAAEIGRAHV